MFIASSEESLTSASIIPLQGKEGILMVFAILLACPILHELVVSCSNYGVDVRSSLPGHLAELLILHIISPSICLMFSRIMGIPRDRLPRNFPWINHVPFT
jgi:hypothetical protein